MSNLPSDPLAQAAVAPITAGMVVGLGTGRAAARAIRHLAYRDSTERLGLRCVATSAMSASLAQELGLRVIDLNSTERVDYLFDGADEIDPQLAMIKGGGGAMTRERLVAHVCRASGGRCVYIADTSKQVSRLGQTRLLPIEVLPMALAYVAARLDSLGLKVQQRRTSTGQEYLTDNGGHVLDAQIPEALSAPSRLAGLARDIRGLAGVVDHGIFLTEADEVIVEAPGGVITRIRKTPDH